MHVLNHQLVKVKANFIYFINYQLSPSIMIHPNFLFLFCINNINQQINSNKCCQINSGVISRPWLPKCSGAEV